MIPTGRTTNCPGRFGNAVLSWLYSYSLGIALALLFIASFVLHWWASLAATNEEALRHGGETGRRRQ
jgi:hypothetical protein